LTGSRGGGGKLADKIDSLTGEIETLSDSVSALSRQMAANAQTQTILLGVIAAGVVFAAVALLIIAFKKKRN
jgi:hypothetical protein